MNEDSKKLVSLVEILEARVKHASAVIANIGVLTGILVFILGFSTYFYGIKPSQDAVDKLEQNMDKRIILYLETEKKGLINRFVDTLLLSNNLLNRALAANYFILNSNTVKLNSEQLLKIAGIIENPDQGDENKTPAIQILFYQGRSKVSDHIFKSIIEYDIVPKDDRSSLSIFYSLAIQYYCLLPSSKLEYIANMEHIITNTKEKQNTINAIINQAMTKERWLSILYSEKIVKEVINEAQRDLAKNNESLASRPSHFDGYLQQAIKFGVSEEDYRQTYFHKALQAEIGK